MKSKLAKFSEFAHRILPHEGRFLSQLQRFEDDEKKAILLQLVEASSNENISIDWDEAIDKRKFSYIKGWCENILSGLDVDNNLEKLLYWEKLIMSDSIALEDEKELLKLLKKLDSSHFNFVKLYDVARSYRHYLQIRLRYKDYEIVHLFLSKYRTDYEFSRLVNDKLHDVTNDITLQYAQKLAKESPDNVGWLRSLFYNEALDGYNRHLAWIRLVFIAHNKRDYSMLEDIFLYFEKMVDQGMFYSRRILTNFYSQYLLYYASSQNFEKAAYYGYLSIKEENNDYLYYVNNLSAVLLRAGKPMEAMAILKKAANTAKTSLNFHNKIGHTAYQMFALIDMQKPKQAENMGFVFLTAYKREIFENRWHLFFSAYLKAMLINGNFKGIHRAQTIYRLKQRDDIYKKSANYTPTLPWIFALTAYKTGDISSKALEVSLSEMLTSVASNSLNSNHNELIDLARVIAKIDL